ncbi:hypothetical protein KV102_09020 [Mumia sp. zg.B53]|uniref:hypothetical protein n=1 Tax=Mumia sp. zg.B53 TaxID=2855449 RepID=UPI001C6EE129|nr:hypothetical protein [Mumia sp. zg.B53]MBW9214983.1 hypothetical protein [Mumia sp. zg.B53]
MMLTEDHFASEYHAAISEHPAAEPDYVVAADGAGARAVAVEVETCGEPAWSAAFAAPGPGVRALTILLGTPAPTGPVVGAEVLAADGLLLLLSPWSIVAVDVDGVRWTTERIAIDGLRIDESDGGWVRGVADPNDDKPRDFAVELSSGRVVGGSGVA